MPTTMNILEFLDAHSIEWCPIKLRIVNGKKIFEDDLNYTTIFKEENKRIRDARKAVVENFEFMWIDTSKVIQIDVDTTEYKNKNSALFEHNKEWERVFPSFPSVSTGNPHYFIRLDDPTNNVGRNRVVLNMFPKIDGKDQVEILCGQASYARISAQVTMPKEVRWKHLSVSLQEFCENYCVQAEPIRTTNQTDSEVSMDVLTRAVMGLNPNRAVNYTDWRDTIFSIAKASGKSEDGNDLAHEFSKQCRDKYDIDAVNRLFDESNGQRGFGSILHMLAVDNKELCETIKSEISKKGYLKVKEDFEKKMCKVIDPTMFVMKRATESGFSYKTKAELLVAYQNLYYFFMTEKGYEKAHFVQKWLEDENMKQYDSVDFLPPPLMVSSSCLNLFTGFEIYNEPQYDEIDDEAEIMTFIENHIRSLVNYDEQCFEYLMNYIAHMFQRPGEIPRVALVFKGEEGAGKNTLTDFLKSIIGSRYCLEPINGEHTFGRFTEVTNCKILCVMNEAEGAITKKNQSVLKSWITDKNVLYEPKGKPAVTLHNCMRLMFYSNKDFIVPIGETDRRYVVFGTSSNNIGNVEYFTKIHALIERKDVQYRFFKRMMERDISMVNFTIRPITEIYKNMKELPLHLEWVKRFAIENLKKGEDMLEISSTKMFHTFKKWAEKLSIQSNYNGISFPKKISQSNIDGLHIRKTNAENLRVFKFRIIMDWLAAKGHCSPEDVLAANAACDSYSPPEALPEPESEE